MKRLFLFLLTSAHFTVTNAAEIYTTDFEDAVSGVGNWGGFDGWITNAPDSPAQGIDLDLIAGGGLGKTAFLGYSAPADRLTTVARAINHDSATTGVSRLTFIALMGIEDSRPPNTARDDFYLSFYNASGERLAALRFDNESPTALNSRFGIWRESNRMTATGANLATQFDTLVNFVQGELFDLEVQIDIASNSWSSDIGGLPLFQQAPFTQIADSEPAFVSFEWLLTDALPSGHGNNFLLLADFSIRSTPVGTEPFESFVTFDLEGRPVISWQADPGFTYEVQYSANLHQWLGGLPGGTLSASNRSEPFQYTDSAAPAGALRFYRVVRVEAEP